MTVRLTRADESRHDFAFIAGVVIGAISGALVTLALTPMSGADTREKLRSKAGDLGPMRERAMEAAAPVKEKAGSIAATAAEKAQSLAASGKEHAAGLAAKSPLSRGGDDAIGMDADEANALLASDPAAHPGGTVTASALAEAGANDTDSNHLAPGGAASETGNGRVNESPAAGTRPENG